MLIQQDFIMRQIEMIISFLLQLLFSRDNGAASAEENAEQTALQQELTGLLRAGQLGQAENRLFSAMDENVPDTLFAALDFYRQANALTDAQLEAQDFTREELLEGLEEVARHYDLSLPELFGNP